MHWSTWRIWLWFWRRRSFFRSTTRVLYIGLKLWLFYYCWNILFVYLSVMNFLDVFFLIYNILHKVIILYLIWNVVVMLNKWINQFNWELVVRLQPLISFNVRQVSESRSLCIIQSLNISCPRCHICSCSCAIVFSIENSPAWD